MRMAERLGVPLVLLPTASPETTLLIGGLYLVLIAAIGLLLYFLGWLLRARLAGLRWQARMVERTRQHPRVYGLLVVLATAAVLYVAPRVLPFNPRALGMRQLSDVVTVRLKENDVSTAGRALQYLWQDSGLVVMKDKRTAELVLVNVDHIDVIVLSPPR